MDYAQNVQKEKSKLMDNVLFFVEWTKLLQVMANANANLDMESMKANVHFVLQDFLKWMDSVLPALLAQLTIPRQPNVSVKRDMSSKVTSANCNVVKTKFFPKLKTNVFALLD